MNLRFAVRDACRDGPLLVLALIWALAACSGDSSEDSDLARQNILLVTIDTLRADALGYATGKGGTSPRLDQLAAESLVFTNAYSQATHTHPSLTSILTGLIPPRHGVHGQSGKMAGDVRTVATLLKGRGYQTGAFVANLCKLQEIEGTALHQGWDTRYCGMDLKGQRHGAEQYLWDEDVVSRSIEWMTGRAEPWFCWVHLMDPHGEHRPPPDLWDYLESPPPLKSEEAEYFLGIEKQRATPPMEQLVELKRRYAAEVLGVDRLIGRLVDFADATPEGERPALVLTADHGEEFFETWSKWGHGASMTEAVLRVPLLVRAPGVPHRVSDEFVNAMQVAPTILDLTGVQMVGGMDGPSLLDPSSGEDFAVSFYGTIASLRTERIRFYWTVPIRRELAVDSDTERYLPHLEDAPWSQAPMALARFDPSDPNRPVWEDSESSAAMEALRVRLHRYLLGLGVDYKVEERIEDAEFEEQLRALGYLGDG